MSKHCTYCGEPMHDEASFCHTCEHSQIEKQTSSMPRSRKWIKRLLKTCFFLIAAGALCAAVLKATKQPDNIKYVSDHEAIFRNGTDTYRIGVAFGDEPVFTAENSYYTDMVGSEESYCTWTHFYAFNDADGRLARREFLRLVEHAYIESLDTESGQLRDTFEVEVYEEDGWQFSLQSGIFITADTGKRILVWHILLTTGDELIFRQSMEIFQKNTLIFTPDDSQMNTIEELRALIRHIETSSSPEDEVILYLPPVIYEGGVTLSRSYTIFGTQNAEGTTTFTDTVICSAPHAQIVQFVDTTFAGNGTGTGLIDYCGTVLDRCTLRNWDIAAKTGEFGWILSSKSTYQNNGTAIEFNCTNSWYNTNEFPDNCFLDNENAFVINKIMPIMTLTFQNSVFRGNENNVINFTDQPINLTGAIIE